MSKKDIQCDTTGVARGLMSKKDIQCDTTGVTRSLMSKKDRQYIGQKEKGQKDKQWSTKHYTEN